MAIKCPVCQAENPGAKQFYGDCGIRPGLPEIPQVSITRTLETTPYAASVREYYRGDPLNRIHWPSTARRSLYMPLR